MAKLSLFMDVLAIALIILCIATKLCIGEYWNSIGWFVALIWAARCKINDYLND